MRSSSMRAESAKVQLHGAVSWPRSTVNLFRIKSQQLGQPRQMREPPIRDVDEMAEWLKAGAIPNDDELKPNWLAPNIPRTPKGSSWKGKKICVREASPAPTLLTPRTHFRRACCRPNSRSKARIKCRVNTTHFLTRLWPAVHLPGVRDRDFRAGMVEASPRVQNEGDFRLKKSNLGTGSHNMTGHPLQDVSRALAHEQPIHPPQGRIAACPSHQASSMQLDPD